MAADVHDAKGPLPEWVLLPQQQRHHPLPARAVLQVVDQGAQGAHPTMHHGRVISSEAECGPLSTCASELSRCILQSQIAVVETE